MDDTNFDVVVCGTGLTECVLSGLLSIHGHKVLHLDRNRFYGGEGASLNLHQLSEEFKRGVPNEATFGKNNQYNVDLIPKVLMADGEMVKIMRATIVERYQMEFMLLEGSFVFKGSKVHKVPANAKEALSSGLMGFFEKRRAAKFFMFCQNYNTSQPTEKSALELYKEFGLDADTIEFIGHAVALYDNDSYLNRSGHELVMRCRLYEDSISSYGQSPYVYPVYGLGELPATFSRLCAVYNGTYILGADIQEVKKTEEDKFESITFTFPDGDGRSAPQTISAKCIIGDPSYFINKTKIVDRIVRSICICTTPISILPKGSENCNSCQLIIPSSELKRSHDVYVLQLSSVHRVVPEGKYLILVSTVAETNDPQKEMLDIFPLLRLNPLETYTRVSEQRVPLDDGTKTNIFVTESFDPATHFEGNAQNILKVFKNVHGQAYSFDKALTQLPEQ